MFSLNQMFKKWKFNLDPYKDCEVMHLQTDRLTQSCKFSSYFEARMDSSDHFYCNW